MVELSDTRVGLALGIGGLLVMSGWVWQDAAGRENRLAPAWAAFVLLTGGLAFVPYYVATRGKRSEAIRGGLLAWFAWMLFLTAGGASATLLASRNREASVGVALTTRGGPTVRTPDFPRGDFEKAYPAGGAPPPQPAPSPSRSKTEAP